MTVPRLQWIVLLVAFTAVVSCEPKPATPEQLQTGPLTFIQDGKLTREDALLRFGVPASEFENERILTFRIAQRTDGSINAVDRDTAGAVYQAGAVYSLVLVFDARGVLKRHSIVPLSK